jgi:hypothetical protein
VISTSVLSFKILIFFVFLVPSRPSLQLSNQTIVLLIVDNFKELAVLARVQNKSNSVELQNKVNLSKKENSAEVTPSAIQRLSLTSGSLFSTAVTPVPSVAYPASPTPTACANFVFG